MSSKEGQTPKVRFDDETLSVCFFGGSEIPRDVYTQRAIEIQDIAKVILGSNFNNFSVYTGGYGGMMHLVAQTFKTLRESDYCKNKNIQIIGITCDAYSIEATPIGDGTNPNKYSSANDYVIQAESLPARINAMIELGDVFIALPGSQGTLHELISVYEAYRHPVKQIAEKKNTRLLIHTDWLAVLEQFQAGPIKFRGLENVEYFTREDFGTKFQSNQSITGKRNPTKGPQPIGKDWVLTKDKDNHHNNAILREFQSLVNKVFEIVYGDANSIHENLNNPILAIDFGYFNLGMDNTYEGNFLTYSTEVYLKILEEKFFKSYRSLMFNDDAEAVTQHIFSEGSSSVKQALIFHSGDIPESKTLITANPEDWIGILKKEHFGKHWIWRTQNQKFYKDQINQSVFFLFDTELPQEKVERLMAETSTMLLNVATSVLTRLHEKKDRDLLHHALLSAISQIFARNMAHNIGSHVSYRATNPEIKKRIKELYGEKTNIDEKQIIAWIDLMSERLDKYEIDRNEYLADYNLSPQTFRFYQDVVLPFCENTLIMDNLALAEGAKYNEGGCKNNLSIRVFIKREQAPAGGQSSINNGYQEIIAAYDDLKSYNEASTCSPKVTYPHNFPYLLKAVSSGENSDSNKNRDELVKAFNNKKIAQLKNNSNNPDVEVLMHSRHGFYSILENFIRNAAKHNRGKLGDGLVVCIYLNELPDRFEVLLCDNVSEQPGNKLYYDDPTSPGLYQRINGLVIDNTSGGGTTTKNLGFVDMKVNSFLFKHNSTQIQDEKLSENFKLVTISGQIDNPIKCVVNEDIIKDEKFQFGYQFELLKPKTVLWIGGKALTNALKSNGNDNNESTQNTQAIANLKSQGIVHFETLDGHLKLLFNSKEGAQEIAAYEFIVFDNTWEECTYLKNQIYLPTKVIILGKGEVKSKKPNLAKATSLSISTPPTNLAHQLIEFCWVSWLNRLGKKVEGYVYYEGGPRNELDGVSLRCNHEIKCANNKTGKLDPNYLNVIFDHHGKAFFADGRDKLNPTGLNFYTDHFKQHFSKASSDFVALNYLPPEKDKLSLLSYRMLDSATTNIFVLDERIALRANSNVENPQDDGQAGIQCRNVDKFRFRSYCYANVFPINQIEQIENKNSVQRLYTGTQNYHLSIKIENKNITIKSPDCESICNFDLVKKDVLVIHRTYLKEDVLGMNVKEFMKLASEKFGCVIVTSGGGYPHGLETDVRFVPFSLIERNIDTCVSKVNLVGSLLKIVHLPNNK